MAAFNTKILRLTFCILLFPSAALAVSSTSVSDYEAILHQLAKLHKEIKKGKRGQKKGSPIRRQRSRGKTNPLRNNFLLFHPLAL
jgi:hypothetical protein